MNSFQAWMNAKIDVATRPGATSGSRIFTKAREAAVAVDHRGLLEVARDAEDEAAQRPDRERQHERQVRDDQPAQLVHLVVAGEHDVQRDDQRVRRQHLDHDDQDDERLPAREAVLGERDGGEEGEPDRERDDDA